MGAEITRITEICGHSWRTYLLPLDLLCNVSNSAADFLRDRQSGILFWIDCRIEKQRREYLEK